MDIYHKFIEAVYGTAKQWIKFISTQLRDAVTQMVSSIFHMTSANIWSSEASNSFIKILCISQNTLKTGVKGHFKPLSTCFIKQIHKPLKLHFNCSLAFLPSLYKYQRRKNCFRTSSGMSRPNLFIPRLKSYCSVIKEVIFTKITLKAFF